MGEHSLLVAARLGELLVSAVGQAVDGCALRGARTCVCVCVTQLRCGLGEHVGVTAKPVLLLPPRHTMPALVWLFGQLLQAAVFGHCPVARAPAAGF